MTIQASEGKEVVSIKYRQIRSRLEAERKRILGELDQLTRGHLVEERREGSPFGKREEEANECMELEKRLTLEKRLKTILTEVEHAIQKLDNGTYGFCDKCSKAIDPGRLEAQPHAILCMGCQQHVKITKT